MTEGTSDHEAARLMMDYRFGAAARALRRRLEMHPDDIRGQMDLAVTLSAKGDRDSAARILGDADAQTLPNSARARYLMASGYQMENTPEAALARARVLIEATTLDPGFDLARLALARYHIWATRDFAAAREEMELMKLRWPRSFAVWGNLVTLALEQRDSRLALSDATRLVRLRPADFRSWLVLTTSFFIEPTWRRVCGLMALSFLSFVPGLGPAIVLLWTIHGVAAFRYLRGLSPHLGKSPLAWSVGLLIFYIARWSITGRLFP